jgi:hypothetical protein
VNPARQCGHARENVIILGMILFEVRRMNECISRRDTPGARAALGRWVTVVALGPYDEAAHRRGCPRQHRFTRESWVRSSSRSYYDRRSPDGYEGDGFRDAPY